MLLVKEIFYKETWILISGIFFLGRAHDKKTKPKERKT
jgi:hypothetical protein